MFKSKSPRGKGSPGAFAPGFTTEENSDPSPTAKSPPQKRSVDEGSDSKTRKVPPTKKLKVVDIRSRVIYQWLSVLHEINPFY